MGPCLNLKTDDMFLNNQVKTFRKDEMFLNNQRETFRLVFILFLLQGFLFSGFSQSGYWQQHVKYVMDVELNVVNNRFTGKQQLEYTNNSPDTLRKVFYHLYWNAFQPNSMMDNRSRDTGNRSMIRDSPDWDPRVKDRIQHLTPEEIGYQKIISLRMNGVAQPLKVEETILEVKSHQTHSAEIQPLYLTWILKPRFPCRSVEADGIIRQPRSLFNEPVVS